MNFPFFHRKLHKIENVHEQIFISFWIELMDRGWLLSLQEMDIRRTIVSAQYSENKSLLPHSIWTANLNMILYMVHRIIWIVSSLILTIFLDNAIFMKVLSCKIAYLKKKLPTQFNIVVLHHKCVMYSSWNINEVAMIYQLLMMKLSKNFVRIFGFSDGGNTLVLPCINTVYGYPCLWYISC